MTREKWDVLIVALVLLLVAILLFWRAAITKEDYWRGVLFALAHAAVVVGVFSLLLELPHITNFVVRELGKVVYGREYLERNRILIPEIRRTADLVYYGEPALAHPQSLYNFIDRNIHRYYISHYRRQYQEIIDLRFMPDGTLSLEIRTTYILTRNPARSLPGRDLPEALNIPFFSFFVCDQQFQKLEDHLVDLHLRIDDTKFTLSANRDGLVESGPGGTVIPIHSRQIENRVEYEFSYSPPEALLSAQGEVGVEILERVRLPYRNDIYAMRMSLPTQNFTLVCNAPDDVRLIPASFDMDPKEETTEARGHVVMTINDWLLPGHGVCLVWDLPAPPTRIREEERAGSSTHELSD